MIAMSCAAVCAVIVSACGGNSNSPSPRVTQKTVPPPVEQPSSVTTVKEPPKPEPFHATSGPGDAPVSYVRDERSSRLDVALPKGHAAGHELWRAPLEAQRLKPCRGLCPSLQASFVITAGNRVAVVGGDPLQWTLFDTTGRKVDSGKVESASNAVRLDRASGAVVPDETRAPDLPEDAKVAAHKGLVVMVKTGGVHVGERAIEGRFDAFDVAIDEREVACVVVRQADDLMLWTVPLAASGGIGRQRIAGTASRRLVSPPILGKSLRVLILDSGMIALTLDGKRAWERRSIPTGGASMMSDDHLLVADNGKILDVDPRGKSTEIYADNDVVFTTAPILSANGTLYVASGELLHAISFN